MSEDKIRAEFGQQFNASKHQFGRGAEEYAFEWFKKGRQSIAKEVPVEAIKLAIDELDSRIGDCITLTGRDDINQPARARVQARLGKAKAELESFLRTIEEMKQ